MKKTFVAMAICLTPFFAFAQTDSSTNQVDQIIEDKIENIASSTNAELDYNTLLDQLNYYRAHPLNLNTATQDELNSLFLLNPLQVEALINHIKENGKLIALEELQSIDTFDPETIYRILPYVRLGASNVRAKVTFKRALEEGRNSFLIRYQEVLETPRGYSSVNTENGDTSRYLGSKAKMYAQYRFRLSDQISFGITAEKDPGEQFFKGTQPNGFDFYSAHLFYKGSGWLKSFTVGDFDAQYGQGLTLGTGLTFGKSYDVMNIKKNADSFFPFTSSNENIFMRGAAVSIGSKRIVLDLFYSNHNIDANVVSKDSLTSEEIISSFEQSGYHRTYAELADKHSLNEILYGGHLQLKQQCFNIGITGYTSDFDKTLIKAFHPYNQFEFSGSHNVNAGFDYNYIVNNFNLFGEVAGSNNGGKAYLNGALISLDQRLSISILQRHYDRNYQNLFSNAFAESSSDENEEGLFLGIVVKPARNFAFNAYYDQFKFPWLKYLVNAPSAGNSYVAQLTYVPSKGVEAYFRIKTKDKPADVTGDDHAISYMSDVNQSNYRFNIRYKITGSVTLGNRVEYVTYRTGNTATEKGVLIYQDINYKPAGSKFSYALRYAIFDTDSYDTRIYAYESDVLYAYSIPFLYGAGSRFFALVHYRIISNVDTWLRYSITMYDHQTTISSGLDQINGNQKSDITAQLRFQF